MNAFVLLSLTIVLLSAGQVAQKFAALDLDEAGPGSNKLFLLAQSRYFWLASVVMVAALVVWMLTLSLVPVSRAYPVLSLSFVLTAAASQLFLRERIGARRWCGIVLIVAGAALLLASL